MKTRFILFFLVWSFATQAQQINTVEYFFDTDPGFGNATQVTVNSTSLDSTFNFAIASLPAGLHTFFVRLKNSANQWSTVYQKNVLIVNGTAGTTQLIKAEYFFDTDPGIGNGTSLALSNTALDSTLNFSTNGLTPGVHNLFVRLKNSNNNWSTTYQHNFLAWPGISGPPQIQSLHYFIDTVSNSVVLPLNLSATLDTTISVNIPDNGGDMRKLGLRLKNQTGELGNATLTDVSLCSLYGPQGGFRSVRFANSYTFIDNSLYNPSKKIKWIVENVVDSAYNDSKIYNYTFPSGFYGYKSIKQITGSGCRVDTAYKDVVMQGIEKLSPDRGFLGNDLVLNIFGGDLDTTTQVFLQHGSTIVFPYDKVSYLNKILSTIFDFHNTQPSTPGTPFDYYDLHVHFSNGHDTTIVNAVVMGTPAAITGCFEAGAQLITDHRPRCSDLKKNDETYVTADLTGPPAVRISTWNNYTLNVTNVGNVLAKETPAWIIIPAQYDVKFDIDWNVPDSNTIPLDSLALDYYQEIDTIMNGHHYQYKMYGLIPPFLMPGQNWAIDFKIRASQQVPDKIIYWVQRPMFGSPFTNRWANCLYEIAGYFPYTGCATAAFDFFHDHAGFPKGYRSDFSHGILRGVAKDVKNLAWNVVGVPINCGAVAVSSAKKVGAAALKKIAFWESKVADKTVSTLNNNGLKNCGFLDFAKETFADILVYFSLDPNNITGNNDYDTLRHYINNYSPQHYAVTFENTATATTNAQHVYITDTLNSSKFDFNTFQFTGYRIGDSSYVLPPARTEIFQTTRIKNNDSLKVKFVGKFDTATGIVRCDFYSMDTTGNKLIPDTSLNGFLPPNTDGISGTGNMRFSISAKNLNTLDTFTNKASIYFDTNTPIETNTWINTVDTTSPTGHIVNAIIINDTTVKLVVQHADIGSGFSYNEFYSKTALDTAFKMIGQSAGDTITFIGMLGETYQMFSLGLDNVGNRQLKDSVADITFTLTHPLPLTWLSFAGRLINTRVELKWITANELNTSRFEVEKSTDGNNFNKIGTMAAAGNTTQNREYISWDDHPVEGNNYYRIKQIDLDDHFTCSTVVRIYYGKEGAIVIAPNPAKDYVNISGSKKFDQIQLIDGTGKLVRVFTINSTDKYSLAGISKGLYYLKLFTSNETKMFKLLIE